MKKKKSFFSTRARSKKAGNYTLLRWGNLFFVLLSFAALIAPQVDPRVFWPIAIIGLIMPGLLLAHLLFFLFWVSRKDRYFLFSLATLVMSFTAIKGLLGFHAFPATAASTTAVKVVSYNAHLLKAVQKNNQAISEKDFGQVLEDLDADVIALQEFVPNSTFRGPYLAAAKAAGYIHQSIATNTKQEGARTLGSLAVFSKYPLKTIDYHKFNVTHGYQIVEIQKADKSFRVVNIHLSSNQVTAITNELAEEGKLNEKKTWSNIKEVASRYKNGAIRRSTQAEIIQAKVNAQNSPTIVCGDFNDTSQSFVYRTIKGGFQDSFVKKGTGFGASYAGKIPALRIDYILASPNIKVLGSRRRSHYFSDHYAVEAVLDF